MPGLVQVGETGCFFGLLGVVQRGVQAVGG